MLMTFNQKFILENLMITAQKFIEEGILVLRRNENDEVIPYSTNTDKQKDIIYNRFG